MAQKTATSNPIANFYEAQTIATAEIARAALDGLQRLQKLTLQAMREVRAARSRSHNRWQRCATPATSAAPFRTRQPPQPSRARVISVTWCKPLPP